MSAYLRDIAREQSNTKARQAPSAQNSVCALMKVGAQDNVDAVAEEYQCQVLDHIGDIYIVQIPIAQLGLLSLDSRVQRIEAHQMPQPTMNDVPARIGADMLWAGLGRDNHRSDIPILTGKNVIAGVVDFGFDFRHPMFLDSTGVTRICQFYDMTMQTEEYPKGVSYPKDSIIKMEYSPLAKEQYHGTNVASVMAGSKVYGERDSYSGIAPKSDIVMAEIGMNMGVRVTKDGIVIPVGDLRNSSDGTTASFILAIKRIFDYADEQGKPCVVNFSGGMIMPFADPCVLEDDALQALIGPGHVIVVGAGNDGRTYATLEKSTTQHQVFAKFGYYNLSNNTQRTPECYLSSQNPQKVQFIFGHWNSQNDTIYEVLTLNTDTLDLLSGDTCFITGQINDTTSVRVRAYKMENLPYSIEEKSMYQFNVDMAFGDWEGSCVPWAGDYSIKVLIESDYPCEMYTYPLLNPFLATTNPYTKESVDCLNAYHTIAWPASSDNVLSVGAITSQKQRYLYTGREVTAMGDKYKLGEIAWFSSRGPTWYNTIKPDVVAPGVYIATAACMASFKVKRQQFSSLYDIIDYDYITLQSGTSIASPIVAGIIALWLQAKPDLTPAEIKEVLSKTCTHPVTDEEYPNIKYGYGEIDAYAGLLHVLDLPSAISELSMKQPSAVRFQLNGKQLSIIYSETGQPYNGQSTIHIYTTDGRMVATGTGNTINLSTLGSGVYAVQFNTLQKESTGSTLIRL